MTNILAPVEIFFKILARSYKNTIIKILLFSENNLDKYCKTAYYEMILIPLKHRDY